MEYSFWDFLKLVGSLGLFIYGMKIMSEGLQKVAGNRLRQTLRGMTSTRLSGVFTGIFTTALIQSSSATTVMVVSFVNAGLLTFSESIGVIMGANIGTTVTAWLISIFGFKIQIAKIAIMMIGVFFPFLFSKRANLRNFAEFVLGFGILFIGLDFLKSSVPDIKDNPQILEFLAPFTDAGYLSILLFVLVGTVLTVVIQSSSATMAVTLVMLAEGWIDFEIAASMVLGENIGTTITANLAAVVGNVHAKRTARFHFFFNVLGVLWMLAIFNYYISGLDFCLNKLSPGHLSVFSDSQEARESATLALSLFHTSFNILNVFLLIGLVPALAKLVEKLQPSRGDSDEEFRLKFISTGLMATPALSLENAKKEIQLFAKLVDKMSFNLAALLFDRQKDPTKTIDKIRRREEITDNMELELADYLAKISESDMSPETSEKVRGFLRMANDLERVADIIFEMSKNYERMKEHKIEFPDEAKEELRDLLNSTVDAIKLVRSNLKGSSSSVQMKEVFELENEINNKRSAIYKTHQKRLETGVYNPRAGIIFLDFINRCEKIGDHLVNVNEAIVGEK